MPTIIVFKATDGRWSYCPKQYRHWKVFALEGVFLTEAAAVEAAMKDQKFPIRNVVVER